MDTTSLGASFRDPSGFVFQRDGVIYRQVNRSYAEDFDHLLDSGLYQKLVDAGLLLAHQAASVPAPEPALAFQVIQPEQLGFISYPYEWCFSQLQDAALLQLRIQRLALKHGMILKDCSAYNVQFRRGKPVLIDTLSFERYREGEPWGAYRQFCQHFLAPLALMSCSDARLSQLLRVYIDGIPLDLAAKLLPARTRFVPSIMAHLRLHAGSQKRHVQNKEGSASRSLRMSRQNLDALLESLQSAVRRLTWQPEGQGWAGYYSELAQYSPEAAQQKRQVVAAWIEELQPGSVWDLGANTGEFSRMASQRGIATVAIDLDLACVEQNYRAVREQGETHLLPLALDLTNPSPAIGWNLNERLSLLERGPAGLALALALVHHLAIGNNVPFRQMADFFAGICHTLIVEFVSKSDPQVEKLLASRRDVFDHYTQAAFEQEFGRSFHLQHKVELANSGRVLYLMARRRP